MAYDALRRVTPDRASKEYLAILRFAAHETEAGVDDALRRLIDTEEAITAAAVEALVKSGQQIAPATELRIDAVDLDVYDQLLQEATCAEVAQ